MTTAPGTAMSDMIVATGRSRNGEHCTGRVAQRRRDDGDLKRSQFSGFSINLLYAPMELLPQIGLNDVGVQRIKTRMLDDCLVEVYETLLDEVVLVTAVSTVPSLTIDEGMERPNEIRANGPLLRVLGYSTEEEKDGETCSEFIFLELDAGGPVE